MCSSLMDFLNKHSLMKWWADDTLNLKPKNIRIRVPKGTSMVGDRMNLKLK